MIRVAVIVKGVEQDLDVVVGGERVVAAQLARDDAVRLRVVTHDAEVDRLVVDDDAYLGRLRYRLAGTRVLLHEVGRRLGLAPRLVVEHPIHPDRRRDPVGVQRLGRRRLRAGVRSGKQDGEHGCRLQATFGQSIGHARGLYFRGSRA